MKTILFLFLLPGMLCAQHDFDSLYKHSEDFKSKVKIMGDTLDLFSSNKPMNMTIVSDFKKLINKKYDREYQDAIFIMDFNDTVQLKREVKIKPRGNYRLGSCYFPPVMLNFEKDEVYLKTLKEFDKVKMVNNCKMQGAYEKYIVAEYLVYKMYNVITPYSFRVRLINLKYIDTGRKDKESQSYAFIIEPADQLMERLNGVVLEKQGISPKMVDRVFENRMAIFQFMIGNTDYSIPGLHNMKIFKSSDFSVPHPFPIPYDFDYSGIVNTPYAIPSEKLSIQDVKERLYMGTCQDEGLFFENIQYIQDRKDQFFKIVEEDKNLDEKYKNEILHYLEGFFSSVESENYVKRNLIGDCRD